jgi:hypothetical protein
VLDSLEQKLVLLAGLQHPGQRALTRNEIVQEAAQIVIDSLPNALLYGTPFMSPVSVDIE